MLLKAHQQVEEPYRLMDAALTGFLLLPITHDEMRFMLLALVDLILGLLIICVLPFAWILMDGIGPDSVATTGLERFGNA